MATRNAPIRPFTQPVSTMRKNHLQALCRHFNLDNDRPVTNLRQSLKTHLQDNHRQLENNPIYTRLYPRLGRGRRPGLNLPNYDQDRDQDHNQDHSPQCDNHVSPAPSIAEEWHGIHHTDDDADSAASIANNPPIPSPEPDDPPPPKLYNTGNAPFPLVCSLLPLFRKIISFKLY